ncbi:MAG TPA: NBR1-Ig-like domain-containing protein [Anaerolineales bacterium]|nr:NBR1-Ig-like domain-containing protein [Anaerolineales bacterium]
MTHRRFSLRTILVLVILVSQLIPFGNNVGVASASPCNAAAFVSDVTVPDGSTFSPGAAFVKTWRLKNTGTCTWTSAYSLAFVSGDPLGATTSMTMPTTAPGQMVDFSFDMNAPTTPGHYRGYWMLKDPQGNKFGLGINADKSFWVDIIVSGLPTTPPSTPGTGLMLQGTVRLNGVGLAGVRIYRSYAAYPGVLVATTGADGRYYADFMPIPDRETITVRAELAGYTFDPINYMWLHEHSFESKTLDFAVIPSPTSPPPSDGTVFDFAKEICAATWKSGAGTLPCPGTDGDARGFVLKADSPRLENGILDSAPGLLVSPQNKYNGYIQGFFPSYTVQPGDHFRASVGCAYGSACYVTYRLDYQINNGAINILWSWPEKNEGKIYQLDKDLSALAGKKVNFILTLLATGSATNDRALWGQPRIVHSGVVVPTDTPITPIPTTVTPPTVSPPPPSAGVVLDFAADPCAASWKSGAGALPCPGTDGDVRGFILPVSNPRLENGATDSAAGLVLFPQNKFNGYIQGTYPEIAVQAGDRFQGIVNCAYGFSCYVTFRLDYETSTTSPKVFWSWQEKNEGQFYRFDKDLSALAGQKVKFTLTILASGMATGDRALWGQPRIVRTGSVPTTPPPTTPPPTDTPIPPGNVTEVKASVKVPDFVNCAGTLTAELLGSITTSGPATVKYHWEISGTNNYTTSESTLTFSSAGTQPANVNASLNCGSYVARLVVTNPNAISGQVDFTLSIPTVLPIYDFNTFKVIGTLSCSEFTTYAWRQEACNGESGGCWISQTPLFENNYAGFFRHDGNTICGLNLP